MSLPTIQPRPTRQIYTYGVVLLGLFLFAFLWFIMWAVFDPVRASITSIMSQYDVANSTYQSFELADTFMNNLWLYMLVLATFILLIWVFHYSQRRNVPMVYATNG